MRQTVAPSPLPLRAGLVAALLAVACAPKPYEGTGELEVGPELLDFGTVPINTQQTLNITLDNAGGADVAVLSVTLTEGDPDIYTIDRGGVDTVAAQSSETVAIGFRPEDVGVLETGRVQIRTDLDDGTFYVSLSGTGGPSAGDNDGDGYSAADGDCDDGDPSRFPGAEEVCDGRDNDCDDDVPTDEADEDYDGWRLCDLDCDDHDGNVHPTAEEICDGLDDDCDGQTPDTEDVDADGFSICDGDCDDEKPNVNPDRPEICDGDDNDCDGYADNVDADGDGHTLCSNGGDCDDEDPTAYPIVVSPYGSPYGLGTDDEPFDTIDNGLAHLDQVCRTLNLEPGTYTGVAVDWSGGAVSIVGRTGDPADVTIEAAYGERQFSVGAASLTLRDVTLAGGDSGADGGAVQVLGGTLVLDGVVFANNSTGTDGGAVAATSADVTLTGVVFDGNTAADDGGALVSNGATIADLGSEYRNNAAARGGAMYVVGGTLALDDVIVEDNTADEGGGLAIEGSGSYTIERSWFASNAASVDGGGLALRGVTSNGGPIRNNRITDNTAGAGGGGVAFLGSDAAGSFANNTLTGNDAAIEGNAVRVEAATAAALVVVNNVLHSNDGPCAVYVAPGAGASVSYTTAYLTNSGTHFCGELVDAYGVALDPTNVVRNPSFVAYTDDGDSTNDDLALSGASTEIDAGDPDPQYNDTDGSTNDRGYTGGPAAP